jgi:hypothetical protein
MHEREFGQAYYKDLLKRIPKKFTFHFSKVYSIFYGFFEVYTYFLEILKRKKDFFGKE